MGIIGHSIGFMESWAINRKSATSAASLFRLERDAISTRRYELRWTLSIGPPARINRLSIRVVKAGHRFQHLLSPAVLSCLGTPLPPCRLDRQAAAMAEGLKSGESRSRPRPLKVRANPNGISSKISADRNASPIGVSQSSTSAAMIVHRANSKFGDTSGRAALRCFATKVRDCLQCQVAVQFRKNRG
jgi:hypothetical protein